MEREKQVAFADEDIEKAYNDLKEGKGEEREVYELVNKAINQLKENPFCGIKIQQRLIPEIYRKKYTVDNLWKYNLNDYWRLIYTLVGDKFVIVSVILEWMDHKKYDRRFGYG